MTTLLTQVDWPAVLAGTVVAYALGMVWFGKIFGTVWAKGSHDIKLPPTPPYAAMALQLLGTFLMALLIGATETVQDLPTAVVAVLAIAALQLSGSLFSQKTPAAALVDGGFVVAMGVVMIAAQAVL